MSNDRVLEQKILLPIGAAVRSRDGPAGRLKKVVIDPEDDQVTY